MSTQDCVEDCVEDYLWFPSFPFKKDNYTKPFGTIVKRGNNNHNKTLINFQSGSSFVEELCPNKNILKNSSLENLTDVADHRIWYNNQWETRSLNKKDLWKLVPEELEKNCTSRKEKTVGDGSGRYTKEITYHLPVETETLIDSKISLHPQQIFSPQQSFPTKRKSRLAKYIESCFLYKGQYLDPSIVYKKTNDDQFVKYGTFKKITIPPNTVLLKAKTKTHGKGNIQCHLLGKKIKKEKSNLKASEQTPTVEYMEIDLGKDTSLSMISTMGKVHDIDIFPSTDEEYKQVSNNKNNKISFVTETNHEYLTSYQVHVRKHSDKEWIKIGTFSGNSDRLTEVAHSITPIKVQYVRIIPLTFHGSPSFQVGLYGEKQANTIFEKQNSVETLVYVLTHPSQQKHSFQKRFRSRSYELAHIIQGDNRRRPLKNAIKKKNSTLF